MNKLSPIISLAIALFLEPAHANSDKYKWLLDNPKNTSEVAEYETGEINGEKFIAIIANRRNPGEEYNPAILIFKNIQGRNEFVAEIDLQFDYASGYKLKIIKNSIYLRLDTAHHGIYFSQYQFKIINDKFYLIGIESQSMTLSDYSVSDKERNDPNYKTFEMVEGTSVNLLTSKAVCFLQKFDLQDLNKWKIAKARFDKGLQPAEGVRREATFFHSKELIPIDKFDIYGSYMSFTCHLD